MMFQKLSLKISKFAYFVTCLQLKICSITFKEILQNEAKEKFVRIKIDSLVLLYDKIKEQF